MCDCVGSSVDPQEGADSAMTPVDNSAVIENERPLQRGTVGLASQSVS